MKVLSVTTFHSLNPYPQTIFDRLAEKHGILCDTSVPRFFLPDEFDYDIIHINWSEALISELVNTDLLIASDNFYPELFCIREALMKWRAKAKVVFTRHNELPHAGGNEFRILVEDLVLKHAHAVIHLGEYSRSSFLAERKAGSTIHTVIPHHMYDNYPNDTTKAASRTRLKIPSDASLILVFGAVRKEEEKDFILRVFKEVGARRKMLLSPRWYVEDFSRYGRLTRIRRKLNQRIYKWSNSRNMRLGNFRKSIPDENVQYYFNAADVVLIPRLKTLNSGVIPLAYAFGKPVVGPETGNLGEILESAGNATFKPADYVKAAGIITDLLSSGDTAEQGRRNHQFGLENFSLDIVSDAHLDLYKKLLAS